MPSLLNAAVVILHFGDPEITRASLARLRTLYPNPEAPRVFVVENDQGVFADLPATHAGRVCLPANHGYGAGNNAGIRAALRAEAQFVVLLNNDVLVERGWLETMCAAAGEPRAGLVGAILRESEGLVYGGGMVSWWTLRTTLLRSPRAPRPPDYIHGACMGITKECIEKVGFLKEEYVLYWEDVEYGLRARRAGFQLVVAPTIPLQHTHGSDDVATVDAKTYYRVRNALHLVDTYGVRPARLWARARLPFRMLHAHMTVKTNVLRALTDARRGVTGLAPCAR